MFDELLAFAGLGEAVCLADSLAVAEWCEKYW